MFTCASLDLRLMHTEWVWPRRNFKHSKIFKEIVKIIFKIIFKVFFLILKKNVWKGRKKWNFQWNGPKRTSLYLHREKEKMTNAEKIEIRIWGKPPRWFFNKKRYNFHPSWNRKPNLHYRYNDVLPRHTEYSLSNRISQCLLHQYTVHSLPSTRRLSMRGLQRSNRSCHTNSVMSTTDRQT